MSKKKVWVTARYDGKAGQQHGYNPEGTYIIGIYQDAIGQIMVTPSETATDKQLCSYDTLADFFTNWGEVSALKN